VRFIPPIINPSINANVEVNTLAGRLRQRRLEVGLSQRMLGLAVGLTKFAIQKMEAGRNTRPRDIEAIGAALDISPAWLLFGTPVHDELSLDALEVGRRWQALDEDSRQYVSAVLDGLYIAMRRAEQEERIRLGMEAMEADGDA
jgi:DNA-binding XRE family transcriptional regulator